MSANHDPTTPPAEPSPRPRWGNLARDRKAEAIWGTLAAIHGEALAGRRWADVGCGSGGIAVALAGRVASIVGIDPEPWPEWEAARREHDNLAFLADRFDGPTPPLADGSVDVVVCNQVYEHVGDPVALIRNIARVLAPGGVGYFAGPNLLWPVEPHVFWPFVHWLPRGVAHRVMRGLGARRPEELDAYSATWWTLAGWLRDAGFEVRSAIGPRVLAGLRQSRWPWLAGVAALVPDVLFRLASPFAPGFVLAIRKPG